VLVVISLVQHETFWKAVTTAIACGGIVFVFGASVSWLVVRANRPQQRARPADASRPQ
jgi:hypothetical protein